MRTQSGFTLIEVMIACVTVSILLFSIVNVFQIGIRRWDVQTSYAYSQETANAAVEKIGKDARNSISFITAAAGGNTLYEFTLPADTDAGGHYIPERPDTDLVYVDGPQVAYYLSDISGSQTVTGGTILWRATAPAGSSTFTADRSWSLVNTSVARCAGVTSFAISTASVPDGAVELDMTVTSTSGHTSKTLSISREMYMTNHN